MTVANRRGKSLVCYGMLQKLWAVAAVVLLGFHADAATRRFEVERGSGLEFVHLVSQTVTYKGQAALRLVEPAERYEGHAVALLNELTFGDGVIDVDVAGRPIAGAGDAARGFVGVVFRAAAHATAFDCFYIRPTNGRADDQLRRNHSTQYVSEPDYPWEKLRAQAPGIYESYVDLEAGEWTHLRIEVNGVRARLFVNGGAQPALIVNDLKRGAVSGQVGLWIGPGTEAYFRGLEITGS